MSYSASGFGEFFDFVIIHMNRVREPHVLTKPTVGLHPIPGRSWCRSRVYRSSSRVSQRWVWSLTLYWRASAAESRNSEIVTENGEHGARAIWVIAPGDVS